MFRATSILNIFRLRHRNAVIVYRTVVDYDGNEYQVVRIGNLEWTVQGLRTEHYADGAIIPELTEDLDWSLDASGAMCYYDGDRQTYKEIYGALYNWYAVTNIHNIAYFEHEGVQESGWRAATLSDYAALRTAVGVPDGGNLKEIGLTHWASPNTGATNVFGFTGLPGGYRTNTGAYALLSLRGYLWTTGDLGVAGSANYLSNTSENFTSLSASKTFGMTVRCVRDV